MNHRRRPFPSLRIFSSGILFFFFAASIQAQLIDVDFNSDSYGSAHGGPSLGPTMSGSAVFGNAGDLWNAINAASGSGLALTNADGSASGVSLTFTSGGGYDANSFGGSTPFAATPYDALLEDYLFTGGAAQTITLSGLATNATYNVILFNAGDSAAAGRTTYFSISNYTQSSTWDGVSSGLIAGVNYVEFSFTMPDASGHLVITYAGNGAAEGDVNGFQLQASSQLASAPLANSSAYTWTTLAGHPVSGSADGIGSAAQFNEPDGVAVDASGNIYVADFRNFTIRKITPGGTTSTIAGFAGVLGSTDGLGRNARFSFPASVAVDNAGNLYVGDSGNFTIRKLTPAGTNWVVSTIAGLTGNAGTNDGVNSAARFFYPDGIAVDVNSNLYVADGESGQIRLLKPVGTNWVVTTIANGLSVPSGIAVDVNTNVYVADLVNDVILEFSPVGANWTMSTIAGTLGTQGTNDGVGASARFFGPNGLALDGTGTLYVSDSEYGTIRKLVFNGASWTVTTLAGLAQNNAFGSPVLGSSADGTGANARFNSPAGVALDPSHNLLVADFGNNEIRKCTSAGVVTTIAGLPGIAGSADGTGNAARFYAPEGLALDTGGNIYVVDQGNQTIRRITPDGEVSTVAGQPGAAGTNDGVGSNARFNNPTGLAVNSADTLYVADYNNNTIRLISSAGVVSTIAGQPQFDVHGNPVGGSVDGVGSAARFNSPEGVAVDPNGLVYVADSGNCTIRKITARTRFVPPGVFVTTWTVTTIAGSAGQFGGADGLNTGARFYFPSDLALDASGNLFIVGSDSIIRKMTLVGTNWVVSTVAKVPERFVTGQNGIALDLSDNVYVPDPINSVILKITPFGANWATTVIGGTMGGFRGSMDGAGGVAQFNSPSGIAADNAGNVYVSDTDNNTIRMGVFAGYGGANVVSNVAPAMNGSLTVTLLPPEAGGQWRFPWENAWRNSGQIASNLVAGNYPVEFRNIPGYLTVAPSFTVAVPAGAAVAVTNQYYPTVAPDALGTGTLTVNIQPNSPPNDGWRFLGETSWRAGGSTVTNLLPDFYFVEFEPVAGFSKPADLAVQVSVGLPSVVTGNYLLATAPPAGPLLPVPVPPAQIADEADYPFGFNGQLQSDVGFCSGVAVETNVVLTVAHLVFNDETLAYVDQAYWYNQEEVGVFNPEPMAARGWYVLSGYAAERTNDLQSGFYVADQSSPLSRNLDVAALYFQSPVAHGGYGGYLPSDNSPNLWLTGTSEKMLVGYPVDASAFGQTNIVPGQMYEVGPEPYALALSPDPVAGQEIYTASWLLSYPGNSGGPFYVQYNGYYYPAGVYVGTLYNGTVPSAAAIRAIDSNVVSLITMAASLGDTGTNNPGGGVITIIPSQNTSATHPGYLLLQLGPPSAVSAGASWKLTNQPNNFYSTANPSLQLITTTNALVLQFKSIPGWILPTNRSVTVVPGVVVTNFAAYTVTNPILSLDATSGLQLSGTTNTTYQIQTKSSLNAGPWVPFKTNTLNATGISLITNHPPPGFYRALWLTN